MDIKGWLLFDEECPLCRNFAARCAPLLHRYHYALTPLQTPWVAARFERRPGVAWTEMLLLRADGVTYGGADALLELARSIWWVRPLYWLAHVPGIKPALRSAYAGLARNRNCLGGVCKLPSRTHRGSFRKWLPVFALPALALSLRNGLPPWGWMWLMAVAIFGGAKWLTVVTLARRAEGISLSRWLAYSLLWLGMDARAFCLGPGVARPPVGDWAFALAKTLLGAGLVWLAAPAIGLAHPMAMGWVGMVGVVFLLHFGAFHLLSLAWRRVGIEARPLMRWPVLAPTLSAFWGGRWNRAFSDLMHRHFLPRLAKGFGIHRALLLVFLVSGALHELVISVPARGGYGLPTLYFVLQGLGLLLERSRFGCGLGLRRGMRGRLFAVLVAAGPACCLFHPPFVHRVILPMLHAIGVT